MTIDMAPTIAIACHDRAGGARVGGAQPQGGPRPVEIDLNGRLGLMVPGADGHRAALSFVVSDSRITRIDAVRNPEKLRRL
jgi:RNA polymerase sigma-70 factor (ECF subfamily)